MRIALVTDYWLPTLGGVQTAVKAQREALRGAGHEVTLFTPLLMPSSDPGVVALPVSRVFRPDGFPFAWPPRRVRALLRRELEARRIEVVHTHSEMFAAVSAVRAAHGLGIPVVHTMHGRIDVYATQALPAPALTVPLLALLHGRHVGHRGIRIPAGSPLAATGPARLMWRLMAAQARASTQVIVPSTHFARRLGEHGVRTPMTVLSNGVENAVLASIGSPVARSLRADETMRVLWVGRLSAEKRPAVFLAAARSFGPDVVAEVYGDGPLRAALRAARDPVVLHGSVPQHEVLAAMRRSHLLVSSSSGFDNQPMVVLEAIACGLPVVHCDPDLAEAIPAGGGFLAPTPDAAGIADVVRRLRAEPAMLNLASAAMLAARDRAVQRAEPLLAVYESALEGRGTAAR